MSLSVSLRGASCSPKIRMAQHSNANAVHFGSRRRYRSGPEDAIGDLMMALFSWEGALALGAALLGTIFISSHTSHTGAKQQPEKTTIQRNAQ